MATFQHHEQHQQCYRHLFKRVARLGGEIGGNSALIRELHIYGPEVSLSQRNPTAAQHKGLGKALLREAERIASEEFQAQQMVVLSGIGAKEYYRESGYSSQEDYMVKNLSTAFTTNYSNPSLSIA